MASPLKFSETASTQVTRDQLQRDFELMKDYLQMCFRKEDWHGVMDASADIREILAKLSVLREPAAKGDTHVI